MSKFTVTETLNHQERNNPDLNVSHPIYRFEEVISIKPAGRPEESLYMMGWTEITTPTNGQQIPSHDRKYLAYHWPIFDTLEDAILYRNRIVEIADLNHQLVEAKKKQILDVAKRPAPTHTFRSNKPKTSNYRKMDEFKANGGVEVLKEIPVQDADMVNGRLGSNEEGARR